jgi:hypothetical protein
MRIFLIVLFIFSFCGKSESPKKTSGSDSNQMVTQSAEMEEAQDGDIKKDSAELKFFKEKEVKISPLNLITDSSKLRLLEYTVSLSLSVESISTSREMLLKAVKEKSLIKSANTYFTDQENFSAEVYTPTEKLYDTLLEISKIGNITSETISTIDHTENNESQKIKMDRESLRSRRRGLAANKGSVDNKSWKDREDLLGASEDGLDLAKLEAWRIQDRTHWAKINLQFTGKSVNTRIHVPNYRNSFVNSINFLLESLYAVFWLIPIFAIVFFLFKLYKWYKS